MTSALTIADIISDSTLDTRIISGHGGLSREVSWAHSCEMPDPERWMRPGELLMTVGLCVPQGSKLQRKFIADLDDAGLAGITIGEDLLAPHLTKALFDESELRGFPVLATGHSIPFIAVSRMVALANADRHSRNALRLSRLYQAAARRDLPAKRTGLPLNSLFGTTIRVIDDKTSCVVIGSGAIEPHPHQVRPLRTLRPTTLLLENDKSLDSFAILHLSQVLTVDTNEILQSALEHSRTGTRALEQALTRRHGAIDSLQSRWGQPDSAYRIIATQSPVEERLPLALSLAGLGAAVTRVRGTQIIAAVSGEIDTIRSILAELSLIASVSSVHRETADIAGAAEEAISEFPTAQVRNESWHEFQGARVSLLGRSISEQRAIVTAVLGELAEFDPRNEPLRDTLFAFLDHNMKWNETAKVLNLHRQSVVYRLERVEEVTGRSVRKSKDLAEFYLARTAWQQLQLAGHLRLSNKIF